MPENTIVRGARAAKSHVVENPKSSIALIITTIGGLAGVGAGFMGRDVAIHAEQTKTDVQSIVDAAAKPIEARLLAVEAKVERIETAIVGNPLTGAPGIPARIARLEEKIDRMALAPK